MQTAALTIFTGPAAQPSAVAGVLPGATESAGEDSTTFDAALSSASEGLAKESGPRDPGHALPVAAATTARSRVQTSHSGDEAPGAQARRAATDASRPVPDPGDAGSAADEDAGAALPGTPRSANDASGDSLPAWLATMVDGTQGAVLRAAKPKTLAEGPADPSGTTVLPAAASDTATSHPVAHPAVMPGGAGDARTSRSVKPRSASADLQPSSLPQQDRSRPTGRPAASETGSAGARPHAPDPALAQIAAPQGAATRSSRLAETESSHREGQGLADTAARQAARADMPSSTQHGLAAAGAADRSAALHQATNQGAEGGTSATASPVDTKATVLQPAPSRGHGTGVEDANLAASAVRQHTDSRVQARAVSAPSSASSRQEPRATEAVSLADATAFRRSDATPDPTVSVQTAPATAATPAAPMPVAGSAATPGVSAGAGVPATLMQMLVPMVAQAVPAAVAPAVSTRTAVAGPLAPEPGRSNHRSATPAAILADPAATLRVTTLDPAPSGANPTPAGAWMLALETALQTARPAEGTAGLREAPAPSVVPSPAQTLTSANAEPSAQARLPESHIDALLQSPEFAPMLGARVTTLVREGVEQARIALNPAEMGPVSVQLELSGNQVRVELAAEIEATRLALEQALPTLAGSLREAGFTLAGGGVFQQARDGGAPERNPEQDLQGGAAAGAARSFAVPEAARPAGTIRPSRGLVDLYA